MRKLLRKIVQILDGTPAEYGQRQSGQSLVELALITPLLIVLLSGMVEIGWFANNYLTLLDVTRAGARRGATLQNQMAPQGWDNMASYMPIQMLPGYSGGSEPTYHATCADVSDLTGCMPYSDDFNTRDQEYTARAAYRPSEYPSIWGDYRSSGCGSERYLGFYNDIACTMEASLDPLVLNRENRVDDIVISAFALEMIPLGVPEYGGLDIGTNRPVAGNVPQMVVVGRYPTNANECDAVETAPNSNTFTAQMDPRDPFDFNENFRIDRYTDIPNDPSVIYPYAWNAHFSELDPGYDDNEVNLNLKEKQVGFVWLGQHRIVIDQPDGTSLRTLCLGSQWTTSEVEQLINLTGYVATSAPADREYLPGTGLVLVEIHWEHEMLLKLPVFNPVFNMMSPDGEPPAIYVWAAFPLPTTDPSIQFQ